jgi:hypothetical protein
LQTKNPTALYSDILATAYDELSWRIRGQHGVPGEASESTATAPPVVVDPKGSESSSSIPDDPGDSNDNATTGRRSPGATAFAASLAHWPIFPDTITALAKLSTLGLDLVVLSNVDRASFEHTRVALERGFTFSAIYTAEEIGSYKYVIVNVIHVFFCDLWFECDEQAGHA